MRILVILLTFFLIGWSCKTEKQPDTSIESGQPVIEIAPENLVTVEFQVGGMTCTDCENAISKSIHKLDGIQDVNASHTDAKALVSFDRTRTDQEKIKEAITAAGYEVVASQDLQTPEENPGSDSEVE